MCEKVVSAVETKEIGRGLSEAELVEETLPRT